ncbi:MAG: fibronectin type III domain-containing protein, partial [Candidatus Cloacimonas sp.]|nr:fibronectin type III domain-containing protein [Candidatus Cloacimonas sp.]
MKRAILLSLVLLAFSLMWGQTTLLNEPFTSLDGETADGSTDISSSLNTYTVTSGWTGTKIYKSIGRLKMGSSSGLGYIVTPTVNLSANSGAATYSFSLLQYGTDTSKFIQVLHATDGATFVQVGADISIPSPVATITVNITGGTANSKIKIQAKLAGSNRFYLDDILLTQGASSGIPTLTTAAISAITTISATSGGNVTSQGGSSVTARGVCWNTSTAPTISNSLTSDGSGTGSFVSNLTSLTASTLYHVRAYATNAQGTAYGEEYSFSTSGNSPPAVPTATAATNVSTNSFTANWNAASGATSYRLDVSTSNTFTSLLTNYNNLTVNTTSQAVSGLSANTPYYYRVRAYNTNGTSASSNTIIATTLVNDPYSGYYSSVTGLSGTALKSGLHTILRNTHTHEYSYSNLETQMKATDEDPNNSSNVIELYTGWSVPKADYGGGVTDWNKEHTWSKSHGDFGETAPAGTDLHHLRPCDATVNSTKSNRDFDYGST